MVIQSIIYSNKVGMAIMGLSIAAIGFFASLLVDLRKDTSIDAFMSADHPAVVSRHTVEALFGLRDPIIVALVNEGERGIFNPQSLNLLLWFTEAVARTDNINPERITSLVSVNNITNSEDFLIVEPFYEQPIEDNQQARDIEKAVRQMPIYMGSLVAKDGSSTLISIELLDSKKSAQTYDDILSIIERAPPGGTFHVAGEAAVSGFLGEYINRDSRKLVPLGFVAVFVIIWLAFRTVASIVLSLGIVAATLVSAIGLMASLGVPFFVITNALPPILVGVSVADAVHIMTNYYQGRTRSNDPPVAAWSAVQSIWRPILFTTLTTVFGFLGIVLFSSMPPMKWFGIFAMVGLAFALLYSVVFLPFGLALFARAQSKPICPENRAGRWLGRFLAGVAIWSARHYRLVLVLAVVIFATSITGGLKVRVDREQIEQFRPGEDIVLADRIINHRFDGANYLDVVVEVSDPKGLLTPDRLSRIEALQAYALTLPHVKSATSIVDYLAHLNKSLNNLETGRLPQNTDLMEQQFFLLTSSSDPSAWEKEIDVEKKRALVRLQVDSGRYSHGATVVQQVQQYLDTYFSGTDMSAYLSGRINVDYHWLKPLAKEHVLSIAISLTLVFLAATILFRSVVKGILTSVPVLLSIAAVYGAMGFFGIWLDAATSMFAAIAIGLGIDFGIHIVDRADHYKHLAGNSLEAGLNKFLGTVGRALFINFVSLFACFSIIGTSLLPTVQRFGLVCALAIFVSFMAAITVVPALMALYEAATHAKAERQPLAISQ